jgi:endonuclease III
MARQDQRSSAAAMLERLHDELTAVTPGERWQPTPDAEANRLLTENPFAFLLAVIADYGVPAERAWVLPFKLRQKLCHLDPRLIDAMGTERLGSVLRQIQSGPRFPNMLAKFFVAASRKVLLEYEGDAAGVWKGRSVRDAYFHLGAFLGIGQKKASMAVNILCRDLGWLNPQPAELKTIDVSYDVHIRRVFLRLALAESDTMDEILEAARELSPDYPGRLDLGAWHVGRTWCRPSQPDCEACRLREVCPKAIEKGHVL